MTVLSTATDLAALRAKLLAAGDEMKACVTVCDGPGCHAAGSPDVGAALREAVQRRKLSDKIDVRLTGCLGFCECSPVVLIRPEGVFYQGVSPSDADDILSSIADTGEPVERLLYEDAESGRKLRLQNEIPFYKNQERRLLEANASVRPGEIEDYIAIGGYSALAKTLMEMTPEEVIEQVTHAQLRGRGGAGFPTGLKWGFCRKSPGDEKYVICNADEGDPGAYMDRAILEGNPHSVMAGMLIGGYAIGAGKGIMYVRAEYPLAVANARIAIEQAEQYGLVGKNILGSGFDFELSIVTGAGAFVCGEETALIASVQDQVGEPRPRPPFPAQRGVWDKPTNINNVETWANVPLIIDRGADWFASVGAEKSKGTKVFSLVGKVRNTGLVEVPMGMTLRELVFDIGGGALPGRKIKAVQTGGPSGGCIPAHLLDLPVDYDSLTQAGSIMGSGGLIVMDDKTCMVDLAEYFLTFLKDESCGKCVPCREGVPRMLDILTGICEGRGRESDLAMLEELGQMVKNASLCGLGQTAANPVLSSLRYFREEYEAHIKYKRCAAAVCRKLISSPCQHVCPLNTDVPAYVALTAKGEYIEAANVIAKTNPLPNVCARVCHHPCESVCASGEGGHPLAIRALKRFAMDCATKAGQYPPDEKPAAARPERVAIVGSGPAGLTAAFYLAKQGYQVTIFEAKDRAGGALATAIPEYRLPRDVLELDLRRITNMGVRIRTNTRVGADVSLRKLSAEFDAVFLAVGAERNLKLGIPGEDAEGVLDPLAFLQRVKLGDRASPGDDVVVIGGGNVAVDAARTALRLGCRHVRILYRRTRQEMPADPAEVEECLREGVSIQYLVSPVSIVAGNGRVQGINCSHMRLGGMDSSGRRKPVPIEGQDLVVRADTVIPAIGQRPEVDFLHRGLREIVSDRGLIQADTDTCFTGKPGIFAGGDAVSGPAMMTGAMAAGKWAAQSIHQYITGRAVMREYHVTRPSVDVEPIALTDRELDDIIEQTRPQMRQLPCAARRKSFAEVELGLDEPAAVGEAKRCLRCDRTALE